MISVEITLLCVKCGHDKVQFRNDPDTPPVIKSIDEMIPTLLAEDFNGKTATCPLCKTILTARLNYDQLPPILDTVCDVNRPKKIKRDKI